MAECLTKPCPRKTNLSRRPPRFLQKKAFRPPLSKTSLMQQASISASSAITSKGKENLYKTCIGNVGLRHYEMAKQVLQPVGNTEEFKVRLQLFIENMLVSYAENPAVTKIIHREFDMPSPFFEDLFQSVFLKTFETLVHYITHAQGLGILRSDIAAEGIACVIIGSLSHHGRSTLVAEKFLGKSLSDPEYRKSIVTILIGIIAKGVVV